MKGAGFYVNIFTPHSSAQALNFIVFRFRHVEQIETTHYNPLMHSSGVVYSFQKKQKPYMREKGGTPNKKRKKHEVMDNRPFLFGVWTVHHTTSCTCFLKGVLGTGKTLTIRKKTPTRMEKIANEKLKYNSTQSTSYL